NPQITIQMGSHTDTNGGEDYNKTLSENRAKAAVQYLIDVEKIAADRLTWYGYGESMPIYVPEKNDTEEQENRRTEFRIMSLDYAPSTPPAPAPDGGK
ncbi:MAG: OmpA family protein, partial [Bacteroidia bacterium]